MQLIMILNKIKLPYSHGEQQHFFFLDFFSKLTQNITFFYNLSNKYIGPTLVLTKS